jgi:glycosyltransferase involved in cell wall biosynthesis
MDINYSVIIPHKDIPHLLRICLNSIPRRDDVQIIVVDDNSDPAVVDFEKFPGLDDPRVEVVFTKEGKGAGYARNVGMEHAVGKWLMFADADDYFHPCITDLMDDYRDAEEDVVFFKYDRSGLEWLDYETLFSFNRSIEIYNYENELSYKRSIFLDCVPWDKLIKADFVKIHNIYFTETLKCNDIGFAFLVGFYAKKISCNSNIIYSHSLRQHSLKSTDDSNLQLEGLIAYEQLYRMCQDKLGEHLVSQRIQNIYYSYLSRMQNSNKHSKNEAKISRNFFSIAYNSAATTAVDFFP